MMNSRSMILLQVLVLVAALGLVGVRAGAQPLYSEVQKTYVDDPTGYVRLGMVESELARIIEGEGDNAKTTYKFYPSGDFDFETLSGDPNRDDDNRQILHGAGVISVDGTPFEISARMNAVGAVENISDAVNPWIEPPTPTRRGFEFIYQEPFPIGGGGSSGGGGMIGDITGRITPRQQQMAEYITIIGNVTIMRDTIRISWTVRNDTSTPHQIGFKYLLGTQFGGMDAQDGQPILLSDGTMVDRESVWPSATNLTGSVPDWWIAFDDPNNPQVILRGALTGDEVNDPGFANFAAGRPDRLDIGLQRRLMSTTEQYDFVPSTQTIVGEDWAVGVLWQERTLGAGQSRRYVTYFGLGGAVEDFVDPYVLGADIPFALQANADNSGYEDFNITAYVNNYNERVLGNAQATLKLPRGLSIVGGASRTQTIGDVALNTEGTATWTVHADSSAAGTAEIRVIGPNGKSVSRTVTLPALPALSAAGLAPSVGLDMISVPFQFDNLDAEYVFQSLGSLTSGAAGLARWDPEAGEYKLFPDAFVSIVEPGKGYWLVNRALEEIKLPEAGRSPVPLTSDYQVQLEAGWNMIGNPFTRPIVWSETEVITRGRKVSLRQAIDRQVIRGTLFEFDAQAHARGDDPYKFEQTLDCTLNPWRGYWVHVLDPITLVFKPPFTIGGGLESRGVDVTATSRTPSRDDWRLQIVAAAGGLTRRSQFAGVKRGASDGYDASDVECPPPCRDASSGTLQVYFPHADWGRNAGNFLTDVRSPNGTTKSWKFVVETDATDTPVTLTWPTVREVPRDLNVTLTDLDAGRRWAMRTQEQYVYNSGSGGARHFLLTVEPRGSGGLQITNLTCATTRGRGTATISYTLNAPAAVDAQITSITGKVIKTLASGSQAPAGTNSLVWNGTNNAGAEVPNGTYLVNLIARNDAGEVVKAIRTMVVLK